MGGGKKRKNERNEEKVSAKQEARNQSRSNGRTQRRASSVKINKDAESAEENFMENSRPGTRRKYRTKTQNVDLSNSQERLQNFKRNENNRQTQNEEEEPVPEVNTEQSADDVVEIGPEEESLDFEEDSANTTAVILRDENTGTTTKMVVSQGNDFQTTESEAIESEDDRIEVDEEVQSEVVFNSRNNNASGVLPNSRGGTGKGKGKGKRSTSKLPQAECFSRKERSEIDDLRNQIARLEELLASNKSEQNKNFRMMQAGKNYSKTTIYKPASPRITAEDREINALKAIETLNQNKENRASSSSEEAIDTSDELVLTSDEFMKVDNNNDLTHTFAESRAMAVNRHYTRPDVDGQMPSTSGQAETAAPQHVMQNKGGVHYRSSGKRTQGWQGQQRNLPRPPYVTPEEEKANRLVREAEQAKIQLYEVSGRPNENIMITTEKKEQPHSTVDDDYLMVAAHVDLNTQNKIATGEYIDFTKLVPRDHIIVEEDQRLQMVSKDGQTYLVPAGKEQSIFSFNKWEQAFRVFANIYLRYNSQRAPELIEYNQVIHSAMIAFPWDNVYTYDRDFRMHMAHHPERN